MKGFKKYLSLVVASIILIQPLGVPLAMSATAPTGIPSSALFGDPASVVAKQLTVVVGQLVSLQDQLALLPGDATSPEAVKIKLQAIQQIADQIISIKDQIDEFQKIIKLFQDIQQGVIAPIDDGTNQGLADAIQVVIDDVNALGKTLKQVDDALTQLKAEIGNTIIITINPTSGPVGQSVTLTSQGFTATNNTVTISSGSSSGFGTTVSNLTSNLVTSGSSDRTINFPFPSVPAGQYGITVTNGDGLQSNKVNFTLSGANLPPVINSIDYPVATQNSTITITGSNFITTVNGVIDNSNTVEFCALGQVLTGGDCSRNIQVTAQSNNTIQVVLNSSIPAGNYSLYVKNSRGISNALTLTVINQSDPNQPGLVKITPNSGSPGTLVTITGSNFTSTNNTVNFISGTGAITTIGNISTNNPSQIQFGVPQVNPGVYTVSVINGLGYVGNTALPFTVTQATGGGSGAQLIDTVLSLVKSGESKVASAAKSLTNLKADVLRAPATTDIGNIAQGIKTFADLIVSVQQLQQLGTIVDSATKLLPQLEQQYQSLDIVSQLNFIATLLANFGRQLNNTNCDALKAQGKSC
jgi:hypothetical protein